MKPELMNKLKPHERVEYTWLYENKNAWWILRIGVSGRGCNPLRRYYGVTDLTSTYNDFSMVVENHIEKTTFIETPFAYQMRWIETLAFLRNQCHAHITNGKIWFIDANRVMSDEEIAYVIACNWTYNNVYAW